MSFAKDRIKSALDAVGVVAAAPSLDATRISHDARRARWLAWHLLSERGWSLCEIARRFGVKYGAVARGISRIGEYFTPEQIDMVECVFFCRRPMLEYRLTHDLIAKGKSDNLAPVTHERVKADLRRIGMVAA